MANAPQTPEPPSHNQQFMTRLVKIVRDLITPLRVLGTIAVCLFLGGWKASAWYHVERHQTMVARQTAQIEMQSRTIRDMNNEIQKLRLRTSVCDTIEIQLAARSLHCALDQVSTAIYATAHEINDDFKFNADSAGRIASNLNVYLLRFSATVDLTPCVFVLDDTMQCFPGLCSSFHQEVVDEVIFPLENTESRTKEQFLSAFFNLQIKADEIRTRIFDAVTGR